MHRVCSPAPTRPRTGSTKHVARTTKPEAYARPPSDVEPSGHRRASLIGSSRFRHLAVGEVVRGWRASPSGEGHPSREPSMNNRLRALALSTAPLLVAGLLVGGLIEPSAAASKRPDATDNIAHRGSSGVAPENTIAAVERALAQGADTIENDIQRTADGELVIMHDTSLARTTDVEQVFPDRAPWSVGSFTLAEIKQLERRLVVLGGVHRPARPDPDRVGQGSRQPGRDAPGAEGSRALPGHRDRPGQGAARPARVHPGTQARRSRRAGVQPHLVEGLPGPRTRRADRFALRCRPHPGRDRRSVAVGRAGQPRRSV